MGQNEFSYELTFWSILIENSDKQTSKIPWDLVQKSINSMWLKRYHEVSMQLTKYEGLSYPTHFLKNRGSIIRNGFLKGRAKKPQLLCDEKIITWVIQ